MTNIDGVALGRPSASRAAACSTVSAEGKQLADDIAAAQGPEIDKMTGWLEAWGQEAPADSMDHGDMDHGDTSGEMPGMMDAETMNMLGQATGDESDQMFLTSIREGPAGRDRGDAGDARPLTTEPRRSVSRDTQAALTIIVGPLALPRQSLGPTGRRVSRGAEG